MREDAATKARRLLGEGRLTISVVDDDTIQARCKGSGAMYRLGYDPARDWWCDCPVQGPRCSHLLALKCVTIVTRVGRP